MLYLATQKTMITFPMVGDTSAFKHSGRTGLKSYNIENDTDKFARGWRNHNDINGLIHYKSFGLERNVFSSEIERDFKLAHAKTSISFPNERDVV